MILAKKNMVGKGAGELFWLSVVDHHHGEPLTTLGRSQGRRTAWRARCRQARARSPARGGRSRSGRCRTWHSRRSRSTWKIWICDLRNVQDLVWPTIVQYWKWDSYLGWGSNWPNSSVGAFSGQVNPLLVSEMMMVMMMTMMAVVMVMLMRMKAGEENGA